MTRARFNCLRMTGLPAASMPWTWNTDFAMSRPITVTVFMWLPPNRGCLIGNHFLGASAPVEGATASQPDLDRLGRMARLSYGKSLSLPRIQPTMYQPPLFREEH